jgi:hypothetical protein
MIRAGIGADSFAQEKVTFARDHITHPVISSLVFDWKSHLQSALPAFEIQDPFWDAKTRRRNLVAQPL